MTAHVGLASPPLQGGAAAHAALALIAVAAIAAALVIARRLPPWVLARSRWLAWGSLAIALPIVVASGGVHSVALPVTGLVVWGIVTTDGWRAGVGGAAVSLLALAVTALRAHLAIAELGAPTALIGFLGFLPPWFGQRLTAFLSREPRPARRSGANLRVDGVDTAGGDRASARDLEITLELQEKSADQERLVQLLRDIRDLTGADEAIWWRLIEQRNRLAPGAWSTEDALRPMFFRLQDWGPLVRWTGEERRVQLDGGGELPEFAAAPLILHGTCYGVLTLTSGVGLGFSREHARMWMPRYARQVANLLDLAEVRHDLAQKSRNDDMLHEAMKQLQEHERAEQLEPELCKRVLDITGGINAALIRWRPDEQHGKVQYATEGVGVRAGEAVSDDSLVAGVCRRGLRLVIEDARVASTARSVYGGKGGQRPVPSLAIIPLKHDRKVIGAIVVEGAEAGDVTRDDGKLLEMLATAIHGSLQITWQIDEVDKRAKTDALTGLWNRGHFDEHIKNEVMRTDRGGLPCSLVLVDLDHFKRVNDTYGHAAGDAVLEQVARRMKDAVRALDLCARYGGEELAVLLPQTDVAGATELAERLRVSIAGREIRFGGIAIEVTASFGVASFPETVAHGDGLFPAADKALYAAKSAGRNCVKVAPARIAKSAP